MSLYRIIFTWLALGSLAFAVAPENRTPYISIYYVQPTVSLGEAATIDYYVTDFEQKEYLEDDTLERFVIEYWVNGVKNVLTDIPAGDQSLALGVLPKGKVLFAFQATDRLGVKSHRLYQEFRVVDPAEMLITPEQILYPDLAAFNISSNDTQPVATTQGLTDLIRWASTNGYRKVVLPHGRYRISETNTVMMASDVTLDMNGSTFKLNPNALAKVLMLEFVDCYDAHVVNGIFEGDLLEHDFENAPNNSEWVHALTIAQGSEYSSVENVVITNVTGYGTTTKHRHTYNTNGNIGDKFVPGDVNEAGEDIPLTIRMTNTNYMDIDRFVKSYGFIQLGLYLGYQGNPAGDWIYKAHFYDASKQPIESIEGYLYRRLYPPANARYARFTLYSTRQPTNLCVYNFRSPYNCAFRDIRHVNIRCVGMALTGINNFLVEGCRFDNCGWASATCAFDAEDGWDLMQDLTFRNNVFGVNPRNEFLTCAGHNFVMENNVMKSYIYDRTYSYVSRNNTQKGATYKYGTRARTGYPRVHNNVNNGRVAMTSVTTEPDKSQAVRNDVCNAGASGPLESLLKFYKCEIRDGALTAYAEQCVIHSITNAGSAYTIVDSVVSNSLLRQSLLTVARVERSEVVNSQFMAQGGLIIATSNHLIETDCVIGASWNTNSAFQLTGNLIDTTKASVITAGNSFKHLLLHSNIINSVQSDFSVVKLTNPNFSNGSPDGSMLVDFKGNVFHAKGGTVLKANVSPGAACTLLVNLHYNVYNNIALHTANIANKPNVVISILPALPTVLEVTVGATVISGNAGAHATSVTVTRYMNTAEALTVYLTSSEPTRLAVPVSVVIPAGQTSVTFLVSTLDDPQQTGHQTATISALANGFTVGTASLEIQDAPTLPSAITNTVIYAESFETFAEGSALLPERGWYAGAPQANVVVREPYAYAKEFPLNTTHTQVAKTSETVTNRLAHATSQPTWIEMMLAPHLGRLDAHVGEDETGIQFNENGYLVLFHRDLASGTNRWTQLEHSVIAEGEWVRLTVAVDYETENPAYPGIRYLRLFIDGVAISSMAAYTSQDGSGSLGGFWFPIYHQLQAPVRELSFHEGTCYLDDLTVTTIAPTTTEGTPWPWLAQHGLSSSDDASDFDEDGFTAAHEYIAGTDPNDFESRFSIQAIDATSGTVQIGVQSAVGRLYTLEQRSVLDALSPWLSLSETTDVPGTGEELWLPAEAAPASFFRVSVRKNE